MEKRVYDLRRRPVCSDCGGVSGADEAEGAPQVADVFGSSSWWLSRRGIDTVEASGVLECITAEAFGCIAA
jgi:hypothetical protein